ncbi:hypothetical protein [Sphingomonas sp. Ag1]|jgi:hypothetical protein|uniref:hypothetical protein n=1 Tax=Sphingomonas sp. Ag1 TaxID=1642949 RepID=UPI0006228B98|nr:hypothetical protein [Sphingomonas sp. Ag1]KKI17939.1 hypothetical protein XM50_17190 [Sphingomonas sp. Ag1]
MDMTTPLGCSPASVATGLLLEALGASDTYDYVPVRGLPALALHVPERDALIAVTTAASPMFTGSLEAIAAEHRLDVVLLRIGETARGVTGADFALGSLPCAVWVERDFALYRDASGLWLVPERVGPSVSITPAGFFLEMMPPFSTLAERERGVRRAAGDVARILQPVEVR